MATPWPGTCSTGPRGVPVFRIGGRPTTPGAANSLLSRVQKWSAPKAWAARLVNKIGAKKARVALARKLATILHRMWADGAEFRWTKQAAA